jgi:hypothetical protein
MGRQKHLAQKKGGLAYLHESGQMSRQGDLQPY